MNSTKPLSHRSCSAISRSRGIGGHVVVDSTVTTNNKNEKPESWKTIVETLLELKTLDLTALVYAAASLSAH